MLILQIDYYNRLPYFMILLKRLTSILKSKFQIKLIQNKTSILIHL